MVRTHKQIYVNPTASSIVNTYPVPGILYLYNYVHQTYIKFSMCVIIIILNCRRRGLSNRTYRFLLILFSRSCIPLPLPPLRLITPSRLTDTNATDGDVKRRRAPSRSIPRPIGFRFNLTRLPLSRRVNACVCSCI